MDPLSFAAIILLLPLAFGLRFYLQHRLMARGMRTVIGRLRQHGAVSPNTAQPPKVVGLQTVKPFGRKSYQVMALHYLMQEDFIRRTPDGERYYLSERIHEIDPSLVPD